METRMSDYFTPNAGEDTPLADLMKSIERERAVTQAKSLASKINDIQKENLKELDDQIKETKSSIKDLKGKIDDAMSGAMSEKVKTSAASKIKTYGTIKPLG